MQNTESDEEFFDAIDDEALTPISQTSANLSFSSVDPRTPTGYGVPGRCLIRKSFAEVTYTDLSTGSTGGHAKEGSEEKTAERADIRGVPVNVKTHNKEAMEFAGLTLTQEIRVSNGRAIWVLKFSPDSCFLAVAGEEGPIRIYQVSPFPNSSTLHALFLPQPHQVLHEHTKDVLDLCWSPSSEFLLSAGNDRQAVLWRTQSHRCVMKFPHPEVVTAVSFNSHNADYFATGCGDRIIRVWNIPTMKVDGFYQAPDHITAVAYCQTGYSLYVGLKQGQVIIYASSLQDAKLKLTTELACRNRRGPKSGGRSVTGFDFFDERTFLVSTNDSRIRMYSELGLSQKYKGHRAERGPIKATFSHNLVHVVCGSETGGVYIWNAYNTFAPRKQQRKPTNHNSSYETFISSTRAAVYAALFAPAKIVRLLQERSLAYHDTVSHVLVTAGAEGVIRVYYNCHHNVR